MKKKIGMKTLIIALLSLISVPAFADDLFAPHVDYAVGESPASVTTRDFNGDGKIDLAIANTNNHSISILMGNGNGTFQPKRDFNVEGNPSSIATGDFNGDGKADLVTANGSSLSILIGNGNGTFQINTINETDWYPFIVKIGDFNGDGKTDLATANVGVGTVSVFIGNGDSTFQSRSDQSVGIHLRAMTTDDFNGDGKSDIVVGYSYTLGEGTISVLIGNGDGTFQTYGSYKIYTYQGNELPPTSIATGDFNGDGKIDFAVTGSESGFFYAGAVFIFIGNGDGAFQPAGNPDWSYGPGYDFIQSFFITTGDFDGDGKIDLALARKYSRSYGFVSILTGNGDGTFNVGRNSDVDGYPVSLAVGDFNRDGRTDIASANPERNSVSILLNDRWPIANAGPDRVVTCGGPGGTSLSLDGSASSDPDDDPLTYTWTWAGGSAEGVSPTVTLPLGTTVVTLTVSDGNATATDTVNITVRDTTPPVTTATGGSDNWYNANVISSFSATDSCSGVKEIHYTVNGTETVVSGDSASFTLTNDGTYNIAYYSIDNAGNAESPNTMTVKIDKTPPVLNLSTDTNTLWPPNRKMTDVAIGGNATDATSGVASVVFKATDEYGAVQPTIGGFNTSIPLEAWRDGTDIDGRHYTITAIATDIAGNATTASTVVLVPHEQR